MIIGIPKEQKPGEQRVALTPDVVHDLVRQGHRVLLESSAGMGSSIEDADFVSAGAKVVDTEGAWTAELVVKVKEPQPDEFVHLRPGLSLMTFLHLAANPALAERLVASETVAFANELIGSPNGGFPVLIPMSEVAGRLATQVGAHFLQRLNGGRGVLLSGVPGVEPAKVVVIGAGTVGSNAALIAHGLGAEVVLVDRSTERLRYVDALQRGTVTTITSSSGVLERILPTADLIVGAVLVPGGKAPVVVSTSMVQSMKPGSVIVDVAVDQGGCVETTIETTHMQPVVERFGVIHYGVANIPAAVPRTSTFALANALLPYVPAVATLGVKRSVSSNANLRSALVVAGGRVTCEPVAAALGRRAVHPEAALEKST